MKATHVPFVFMIWAYESASEWYFGVPTTTFRQIGPSSVATPKATQGQRAPPFLGAAARRNTHRYTGPTTPIHRADRSQADGASENDPMMAQKVDDLSKKIEELTAMIIAQNVGQPGP